MRAACVAHLFILVISITLVSAQPAVRPTTLCTPAAPTVEDEGVFFDLQSTAPNGYRVNIHRFRFICEDTATYTSEYYFKSGSASGYEETRWPWILHFTESYSCSEGAAHTYTPFPLVIGEVLVGYVIAADAVFDLQLVTTDAPYGDGILTIFPRVLLSQGTSLFSSGSTTDFDSSGNLCFTYTLDQFGSFASVQHSFVVGGFNQQSYIIDDIQAAGGVYNLISHERLHSNVRLAKSQRSGRALVSELSVSLVDGPRLRVEAAAIGGPVLEVRHADGAVERLPLDESMASKLNALDLSMGSNGEEDEQLIKSQVFASSFESREASLQDPMVARYYELGDLSELDDGMTATARVTVTTSAFEVTAVVLEDGLDEATLKVLSHKRTHMSGCEIGERTAVVGQEDDSWGLLGVTSSEKMDGVDAGEFVSKFNDILATDYAGGRFQR